MEIVGYEVVETRIPESKDSGNVNVPLRSNISSRTPKEQFLSLPPNKNTRSNHSHGVHYVKLFPIVDEYVQTYLISDSFDLMVKNILDNNEKIIIDACQNYLKKCENGQKHFMTPDIDGIINMFDTIKGQSNNSNTKETS